MSEQKLFQGNLDALCGIYALANFLQRQSEFKGYQDESPGKLALEATLRAAEREQLFDSSHMMAGYDWAELGRIARRIFSDYHLEYRIEPIKNLQATKASDLFSELSKLTKTGGGAIITHSRGNHWVFAYGTDGDAVKIKDSAPTSGGNAALSKAQQKHISRTDGLVFRKILKTSD